MKQNIAATGKTRHAAAEHHAGEHHLHQLRVPLGQRELDALVQGVERALRRGERSQATAGDLGSQAFEKRRHRVHQALMSRVVLMSCPTSWYHPTEKSLYGPSNRYGTNFSLGMSANTSSGITALLIVNSRKSLIMTEDSRPDLVWCLSNPANSRTNTASTMFVAAVNAETPASIILPSKYSPHSALYPSSSAASPTYIIATSVTLSLHTQSKHAIAAHSSCNVLASNPPVHAPLASYSAAGEAAPWYAVALPFHWP